MPHFSLVDPNSPIDGKYVYFDTSAIYELHGPVATNPAVRRELLNVTSRIVRTGGAYVSGFKTREELRIMTVTRLAEARNPSVRVKRTLQDDPTVIPDALRHVEAIEAALNGDPAFSWLMPETLDDELLAAAQSHMENFQLQFPDAMHLAVAIRWGISDIVSGDNDFARVSLPEVNIYLPSRHYRKLGRRAGLIPASGSGSP